MIRAALIAAALLVATPAFAQDRYQMEVTLLNNGAEVASSRTPIAQGAPASAAVSGGEVSYRFDARLDLARSQPSGDQMALQANIERNGVAFSNPTLVFATGEEARIEIGDERGELIRLTVTSIRAAN